ncbi:MAG: GNAT family N-acetyltransferase [Chloroflexi bacterium]|nr:GNAT family N-acetyltransferase [Chloroflexota bacterium]
MDSYYRFTSTSLRRVVCRPARSSDRNGVLEFVRSIWGGDDYIPFVWEAWLADSTGQLTVAEFGGRLVGLAKLTELAPQQWWMEGLRIDPKLQGQGIGSRLMDYTVELWQRIGSGVVRLGTSSTNVKVHHMCARSGFRKIGEYAEYAADPLHEDIGNFNPLQSEDIARGLTAIRRSPAYAWFNQLMGLGWKWAEPDVNLVAQVVKEGRAWWWKGDSSLLLLWEDDDDEGKFYPWIKIFACASGDQAELLMDYRRLAAKLNYPAARWTAPLHPETASALQSAGFKRIYDDDLFIFEKRR